MADDLRINRMILSRTFIKEINERWKVHEVGTAEDALALLSPGHTFDLVVMDEIFSDVDTDLLRGSQAIRLLREREVSAGGPRLAVISCTGMASLDADPILKSGADEVWNKPFPSVADGSMQCCIAKLLPQYVIADPPEKP